MIQSGRFLRQHSWSIIKNWIAIIKISHKTTWTIGLTAASSAIDAGVPKKIYGSRITTLVISNEETNDKQEDF